VISTCTYQSIRSAFHMQNMVAVENGGGWDMREVVPSRSFYVFVNSMRPQLSLRSVDFRSLHTKTCIGGGLFFRWGRFAQGVRSSLFTQKKTFFNGPNKAIILHGSE